MRDNKKIFNTQEIPEIFTKGVRWDFLPIIYFHSGGKQESDVKVTFRNGWKQESDTKVTFRNGWNQESDTKVIFRNVGKQESDAKVIFRNCGNFPKIKNIN